MFAVIIAIIVLAVMFLSGRFTAKLAAQRGRSKAAWFLLGALFFLFFPIPWMVLGLMPPGSKDKAGLTPPSAKPGPDSVLPESQTETLPKPQKDTTGYTRGGLIPVRV